MPDRILHIADGFWNIRGSYKVGGLFDVRTQSSLVRRANGNFVLLDAYTLNETIKREVDQLTDSGEKIEAILNLHPFHTIHVRTVHAAYPKARLYGTSRHLSRLSGLPWESALIEDPETQALFADDFDFSVPRGVDLVSSNEKVHFSSVLAYHRASKTIHVDDTLMYMMLPSPMRHIGLVDVVAFHPTLSKALEKRPGATADFRQWAEELADHYKDAENLCAAHSAALTSERYRGAPISDRIRKALRRVNFILSIHERRYG